MKERKNGKEVPPFQANLLSLHIPHALKFPLDLIQKPFYSQHINSGPSQSLPNPQRQPMRLFPPRRSRKIRCMRTTHLLPILTFTPDPKPRTQTGHRMTEIPLIRRRLSSRRQ